PTVEGAQQVTSYAAEELLADERSAGDELAAHERAELSDQFLALARQAVRAVHRFAERFVARPRSAVREAGEIERLAHRHDGRQIAARLRDRAAHEVVDAVRRAPQKDEADAAPGEQAVRGDRIEVVGERFL